MHRALGLVALCLGLPGCFVVGSQQPTITEIRTDIVVRGPGLPAEVARAVPRMAAARIDETTIHVTLDHYGRWVDDSAYGNVWVPSTEAAGENFVPYGTQGTWQFSDAGWYWSSTLSWGWLVFHYGRWVNREGQWAWVPGSLFAPAWVDWRVADGWIGWAPLAPRGAAYMAPYAFCRIEAFTHNEVWSHVVYGGAAGVLYSSSRPISVQLGIGGAAYAWGPSAQHFARETLVPESSPLLRVWEAEIAARHDYDGVAPPNPLPARGDVIDRVALVAESDLNGAAARPGETVLIRNQVLNSRLRNTVSLGTTYDYSPPRPVMVQPVVVNNSVTQVVNNTLVTPWVGAVYARPASYVRPVGTTSYGGGGGFGAGGGLAPVPASSYSTPAAWTNNAGGGMAPAASLRGLLAQ